MNFLFMKYSSSQLYIHETDLVQDIYMNEQSNLRKVTIFYRPMLLLTSTYPNFPTISSLTSAGGGGGGMSSLGGGAGGGGDPGDKMAGNPGSMDPMKNGNPSAMDPSAQQVCMRECVCMCVCVCVCGVCV